MNLSGPTSGLLARVLLRLENRKTLDSRLSAEEFSARTEELDLIFFDEPNHQVAFALKFATAKQSVSNQQCFVQVDWRRNSQHLQLSRDGGAHSFNWTGRAHRLTITLLAAANQIRQGNASRAPNVNSAAIVFGTFQSLHQCFKVRSQQVF